MKRQITEVMVGLFVVISVCCIGVMTIKLGKLKYFNKDEYTLKAKFQSVAGLKKEARIEIAGIPVGYVSDMFLDPEDLVATVEFMIKNEIKLGDDVIASIKTSGLIGDKFVQLSPGASEDYLSDGDYITETESPIDIEELIGKFVFGNVNK